MYIFLHPTCDAPTGETGGGHRPPRTGLYTRNFYQSIPIASLPTWPARVANGDARVIALYTPIHPPFFTFLFFYLTGGGLWRHVCFREGERFYIYTLSSFFHQKTKCCSTIATATTKKTSRRLHFLAQFPSISTCIPLIAEFFKGGYLLRLKK